MYTLGTKLIKRRRSRLKENAHDEEEHGRGKMSVRKEKEKCGMEHLVENLHNNQPPNQNTNVGFIDLLNFTGYTADLEKEIENLRHEISIAKEKYGRMEKLVKKKKADVKKSLIMFHGLVGDDKKKCEKYEKLSRRVKELKKELADSVKLASLLKLCIKDFERREAQSRYKVEELHKQIRDLRHQLWLEKSVLPKNIAERDAVVCTLFC